MSMGNGSYSRVSVQVGADWQVRCVPVTKRAPVLDIDAGETEISVGIAGQAAGRRWQRAAAAVAPSVMLLNAALLTALALRAIA